MSKRLQTSDDRDAAKLKQLGDRARDQVDELAAVVDAPELIEDDNTKPVHILSPAEIELNDRIDRLKAAMRRKPRDTADRLLEELAKKTPSEERLDRVARSVRWFRAIVVGLLIPALTGAYLGIKYAWLKAGDYRQDAIEAKQLREQVDALMRLPDRIRDLEEAHRRDALLIDELLHSRHDLQPRRNPTP